MAQRGKVSKAHEYDARDCCIHCSMYRCNVEASSHVCKPARELAVDMAEALKVKKSLEEYRRGE